MDPMDAQSVLDRRGLITLSSISGMRWSRHPKRSLVIGESDSLR